MSNGIIPFPMKPNGGVITEYVYSDLKNNTYDPTAGLRVDTVLQWHSNGGYGGTTQWRAWSSTTTGNGAGIGWWWGYSAAPADSKQAIACEFPFPITLAGIELAHTRSNITATIYAWKDDNWVVVSKTEVLTAEPRIVYTTRRIATTRIRVVYNNSTWHTNAHPKIYIYK